MMRIVLFLSVGFVLSENPDENLDMEHGVTPCFVCGLFYLWNVMGGGCVS